MQLIRQNPNHALINWAMGSHQIWIEPNPTGQVAIKAKEDGSLFLTANWVTTGNTVKINFLLQRICYAVEMYHPSKIFTNNKVTPFEQDEDFMNWLYEKCNPIQHGKTYNAVINEIEIPLARIYQIKDLASFLEESSSLVLT